MLEEDKVFYEYFVSPSPSSFSLIKEVLPCTKRSQIIQRFVHENVSVVVEDYAKAYQSVDQHYNLMNIGHVTLWDYDSLEKGVAALQYYSQFYDYLNFKSDVPVCEHFNVAKMYKTSVFKNQRAQNKVHKVAL